MSVVDLPAILSHFHACECPPSNVLITNWLVRRENQLYEIQGQMGEPTYHYKRTSWAGHTKQTINKDVCVKYNVPFFWLIFVFLLFSCLFQMLSGFFSASSLRWENQDAVDLQSTLVRMADYGTRIAETTNEAQKNKNKKNGKIINVSAESVSM